MGGDRPDDVSLLSSLLQTILLFEKLVETTHFTTVLERNGRVSGVRRIENRRTRFWEEAVTRLVNHNQTPDSLHSSSVSIGLKDFEAMA